MLQFLILGVLLTVFAHLTAPPADTSRQLVVDAPVQAQLARAFVEARGRLPEQREMDELISRWLLNEVLFRQAKAFGLDQGDEMIRERIITKMRVMLQGQVVEDQPTAADLQGQFDRYRADYDEPDRYDFVQVKVPEGEAEAKRLADAIRDQLAAGQEPEPPEQPAIPYEDRPGPGIARTFGPEFRRALGTLPIGEWQALRSTEGWHLVRLFRRAPGRAVTLDEVRSRVDGDWRRRQFQERSWRAVQALEGEFEIVRTPIEPAALLSDAEVKAAQKAGERDGYRPLPQNLGG